MGKSFRNRDFFEDMDNMEYENHSRNYKKSKNRKNDKKMAIQQARKKAQAERDRAIAEYAESIED